MVPAEIANRILDGENRVRVWREYRGMTVSDLAEKSRIEASRLPEIESERVASENAEVERLAAILRTDAEDLR